MRQTTWLGQASWIANRKTIGWDIFGHNATRADGAVATNANARKNYHVCANPHVILDHNRCGRRYLTLLEAILVPINDVQVMAEQTVAADSDFSVRGDRRAVVDEGVLAYRNMRTFMGHDFDRYNGAYQGNTSKFHISTSPEINSTVEAYRPWQSCFSSNFKLSVEKSDS